MRIRQIKPEFFRDKDMASLPFRTRLTYIGLWCMADDAGWFFMDYVEIARELYGFDGWKVRERWLLEDVALLEERGHIEVEPCGHALIPTLVRHQRFSSEAKRVYTIRKDHEARCIPLPPELAREDPRVPASGNRNGSRNGKERNGSNSAQARENDGYDFDFPPVSEVLR